MSPTLPTIQLDTTPCPRRANGEHEPDHARSDSAHLVAYGRDTDHSVIVRLMLCRACNAALIALSAATAPDDHPGTVMQVTGTETREW